MEFLLLSYADKVGWFKKYVYNVNLHACLGKNALENQVGIAYNKAESIFKGRGKLGQ